MSTPLDPAQIANLLKRDTEEENARRNSRIRRKLNSTEPRTYETWFRLETHFEACENADCIDPRNNKLGKSMVAEVNGGKLCRYCFLAGANKVSA